MSFLDRARQAAEQARQSAAVRTDHARQVAAVAAQQASAKIHEQAPIIGAQTREGLGLAGSNLKVAGKSAKKGVVSLVDRIDPGILADIIIKATALQEKANASLRAKGSPYRIAEIQITAAIPPQMGFSISRIGDQEEELTGREVESAELAESLTSGDLSLLSADEDVHADGNGTEPADAMTAVSEALAGATPDTNPAAVPVGAGAAIVGWAEVPIPVDAASPTQPVVEADPSSVGEAAAEPDRAAEPSEDESAAP